jgi:hypothetical protein
VVESHLVPSGSHPLVRLRLDHSFGANVKIKIYFNIDINHLAYMHFLLPDLRTFYILSPHPVVLTSYPPPFRPPRAHILTRLPDVKEALRRDEGHDTARGLGHVLSEDGRTDEQKTGGGAGTGTSMWGETPFSAPSSSLEELAASSLTDREREEGNRRGTGEDNEPDVRSVRRMGRTDTGNRDEGAW